MTRGRYGREAAHGWARVPNDEFEAMWRAQEPDVDPPQCWMHPSGLTALVGREPVASDDWRWHISLRYGDPGQNGRVPSWEEIVRAAHELRPGVVFVIGVPPRSWWVNVHPDVLHLHETRDEALVAQWREERAGMRPS